MSARAFIGAALLSVGAAAPAAAQVAIGSTCVVPTKVIEWTLPFPPDDTATIDDFQSGAIFVDRPTSERMSNNTVWFVTRLTAFRGPRVYRLDTRNKKTPAPFTSWDLLPVQVPSGGLTRLHVSGDKRLIVVRMTATLQLIDTARCQNGACQLRVLNDEAGNVTSVAPSDVAIDNQYNVYWSNTPGSDAPDGYIQRVNPNDIKPDPADPPVVTAKATRWAVGAGAGSCVNILGPCIAGVALNRSNPKLVYFSAPATDEIGELNTETNVVRYFTIHDPTNAEPSEPRQIDVDSEGIVWVVTGSGHLVRLDPERKLISTHQIPGGTINDPFGIAIDRGGRRGRAGDDFRNEFIGHTNTLSSLVGLLIPDGVLRTPPVRSRTAPPTFPTMVGFEDVAVVNTGNAQPEEKQVLATVTTKNDGTFIETDIKEARSTAPTGITPDQSRRIGTFFYAVGEPADFPFLKRIGRHNFARAARRVDNPRDIDDFDDDGVRDDQDPDRDDDGIANALDTDNDNDCVPDNVDEDDDDDGLEDAFDRPDRYEAKTTSSATAAAGSVTSYPVTTTSNTTLLTVVAKAADLGAPISVEIVDASGRIVSAAAPTPGTALATAVPPAPGTYTVRVKNLSLIATTVETSIIPQELPLF